MSHPFVISQRTVSPPSNPLPTLTFGWLLYSPIKWWPTKVEDPSFSLFFDGCHFGAPCKGNGAAWTSLPHRKPAYDSWGAKALWFWSMADVAMERKGKAAGNRVAATHVGCCVYCVLCFVIVFCVGEQLSATILVETQHRPRQNGQLLHNHIKNCAQRPRVLIGRHNCYV